MTMFQSAAGIFGILAMWLSLLFAMLVVGDELGNSDYRDYGAKWPCHLSTAESDRVYRWSLVALFTWLVSQGSGFLKYSSYLREHVNANDQLRRLLDLGFVISGQLYLAALFLLATLFEWGLACNNGDGTLRGSNFLWGSAALWIAGVGAMHAMSNKEKKKNNNNSGAIFRAEHLVGGAANEERATLILTAPSIVRSSNNNYT